MPKIQIERGPTYECAAGDTVLRAALRAGLGYDYACNVGSCGTCRFELKEGQVQHLRDDAPAWTERDRQRGRWLGCQARPLGDCLIKVRLDEALAPVHRPVRMTGRLVERLDVTHDIAELAFAVDGPDAFLPGQYALVRPEGVDGARAYSMCNLPGEGEWRFLVKHVPDGAATGALFGLEPGATVPLDGPYGQAYLRPDRPRDLLLVAGGSGLSPMISIARAAAASPALADRAIWFFYGGRQPRDICGEAMLATLPGYRDRVVYHAAISEPSAGWEGSTGFIHEVVRDRLGSRLDDFEIYFAGPPPMAQAMQVMLHEAGVPPDGVHFDEFY